jgi:hypothetical protein
MENAPPVTLAEPAQHLDLRYDGKRTTGAKVDVKLSPAMRQALNDWAVLAASLKFEVFVPSRADALVMGRASVDQMQQTIKVMDQTAELFAGLKPVAGAPPVRAIVVVLFDADGFASDAWPAFLDELLARNDITADCVANMKAMPGSLTLRNASMFIQHTFDIAGNAAAGDDEYRFSNEIAHKTAQYLIEARFGRQPDVLRWGLGYVAEQRLYGNVYQFNSSGFVADKDHFDWPAKTREALLERAKDAKFALTDAILKTRKAGTPDFGQQLAWGTLDYELAKDPAHLSALLTQLGALDRAGDPQASSLDYQGDEKAARDACDAAWGKLKATVLAGWLKGMK